MTLPRPLLVVGRLTLTLTFTFLGLLLSTFLIGRMVPIDPVLAGGRRSRAARRLRADADRVRPYICRSGSSS